MFWFSTGSYRSVQDHSSVSCKSVKDYSNQNICSHNTLFQPEKMVKKVCYENECFVLVRDRVEVRQTNLIITIYVLSSLTCLVPCVLSCLASFVPYVTLYLPCFVPHVPCALHAVVLHVLSCLTCPSYLVPGVLHVPILPFLLLFSHHSHDFLFISDS